MKTFNSLVCVGVGTGRGLGEGGYIFFLHLQCCLLGLPEGAVRTKRHST